VSAPLPCPRCGAPVSLAEDVTGYLDWGDVVISADGVLHLADPAREPPSLMADNADGAGRLRACCTNRACGHQWRTRRRFDPTAHATEEPRP
jgi:hypothetical protein